MLSIAMLAERLGWIAEGKQMPIALAKVALGRWKNGWLLMTAGWTSAILITAMDVYGLPNSLKSAWQVISGG
jgi:hypothetical protein